jgi:hypothetical protein
MRIDAHPMVVAAALGLLGPAALADDDLSVDTASQGVSGVWSRTDAAPQGDTAGARLEIFPMEDRLVVDAGTDGAAMWTPLDDGRAQLRIETGAQSLERTLAVEADQLVVNTRLCQDGTCVEYSETYTRTG